LREVVRAAARAPVIRGRCRSSASAVALDSIAPTEELDIVDVDVGRPALIAVAILVLSVLDAALDRDARSLREILRERLRALPPKGERVPFRALLLLPVFSLPLLRGGEAHGCDGLPAVCVFELGIRSEVADEDD